MGLSLGIKIKAAREKKRLTQKDLAELCGYKSQKIVSAWENDRSNPDYETIIQLCKILDVSLNYLFGIDSDEYYDSVSPIETSIIEDFRVLDEIGQSVVLYNLEAQKKRCTENQLNINSRLLSTTLELTNKDLFLDKTNLQYDSMKEKAKNLSKLKKTSFLSYETIFFNLCNRGYNGLICIADLVMIMHRVKVPSMKLYNDIEDILKTSQYNDSKK